MVRRLFLLLVAIALGIPSTATRSAAQITTTAGASVLFFPLVVAGNGQDSIIELSNGSPQTAFAHCVYTPGGQGGVSAAIPFDVALVGEQPTHWRASTGRLVDPTDPSCSPSNLDCDGAGLDPGRVPPVPDGFRAASCASVWTARARR